MTEFIIGFALAWIIAGRTSHPKRGGRAMPNVPPPPVFPAPPPRQPDPTLRGYIEKSNRGRTA